MDPLECGVGVGAEGAGAVLSSPRPVSKLG